MGHMNSDTGECETRQAEDVSNPDEGNDDSYEETHSNEGRIEDYEFEATTLSEDAREKASMTIINIVYRGAWPSFPDGT